MIQISLVDKQHPRDTYSFAATPVHIGRRSGNDVVLADAGVSARHGRIRLGPEGVLYEDLGSTNGTLLRRGGKTIPVGAAQGRRVALQDGDELLVGDPHNPCVLRVNLSLSRSSDEADPAVQIEASLELRPTVIRHAPSQFPRDALIALQKYSSRLYHRLELPELLEHFAECVFELFQQANHLAVYTESATSGEHQPVLSRDREGREDFWPLSRTVRDRALGQGEALVFRDSDAGFVDSESLKALRVRSGMCAPLWDGQRIIGLVQLDARGDLRQTFDTRDLRALLVFAHQLALSMTNTELDKELRDTIARLESVNAQMERFAFYDPLTGLSNRRLFMDRLERALRIAARNKRPLGLLSIDVDHFKQVNDQLGHDAGDMLLKAVANRLAAHVRAQDTVARLGGDEFSIVLVDVAGTAAAVKVAEKVLEVLRQPVELRDRELEVTASIGIAVAPEAGLDTEPLMKSADLALYQAKQQGRDRYCVFAGSP